MHDEYWPLADAVARDLAGRADPSELAHVARRSGESAEALALYRVLIERWVRTHQQDAGHTLATVGSARGS